VQVAQQGDGPGVIRIFKTTPRTMMIIFRAGFQNMTISTTAITRSI
jgi:hypothetical protein